MPPGPFLVIPLPEQIKEFTMFFTVFKRPTNDRVGALLHCPLRARVRLGLAVGGAVAALLLGAGPALAAEPGVASPRVIGGEPTTGEAHPYLVSIGSAEPSQRPWMERHICAGTLISDRYILTAAHCVTSRYSSWAANPAEYAVARPDSSGELSSARVQPRVRRISIHPQYDWQTARFDAAIIELERPIEGYVPLQPASAGDRGLEAAGVEAVAPGWGSTEMDGEVVSTLMQGRLSVIDSAQCASNQSHSFLDTYFGGLGNAIDTESMLCAMGHRDGVVIDTCQGDSGGPLVAGQGSGARLIGITSWGKGCAIRWPGVYTRVSAVQDWISDQMDTAEIETALSNVEVEAIKARRPEPWVFTLSARVNAPVTLAFPYFGRLGTCEITPERNLCDLLRISGKRLRVIATVWVDEYTSVVIRRTSVRIVS